MIFNIKKGTTDAKTLQSHDASYFATAQSVSTIAQDLTNYLRKNETAAKATADANGNNIEETYKTKAESNNVKIQSTAPSDTTALWAW